MKATKYLSMAALALMGTLASCQSDDDFTVARPANAVGINVSVGSLQTTRSNAVATDDTQRQFNQGDQISVSTNDQEAVLFQCTSTENQTWTEAVTNKFLLWTQKTLTFSAYYPATTGTSMTTFTVPTDQSSVEKIALADYMTRQQVISRPEGGSDIQMQLERKMARVIIRISGFGSQYDDDEKTVSNVSIYSEASGIADGNPTGSSTEIQPYAQGNGGQGSTYTALVVPGYGDSGARFIKLTDGEYNTLLVKGIPELEAGNSYTFNLVVGKNKIEVASVTVQDWTTGETLNGGQAEEELAVPVTAITLNKTETEIKVGSTETLSVTAVAPDNATDKTYTWKTSDASKATVDQDGKVTAVAEGTVTIYAEANDGSGVKGNCTVTVTPATITVTINQSDWGSDWNPSFTKDGVTVSAGMIDPHDGNLMDGGTFSTTLGNFTKIVVTTTDCNVSGTGWSGGGSSKTWAGTPASTVSFSGDFMGMGMTQTTIVCTIVPKN
ncbi:fimbrillin family protein [Prevotella sp. E13-27]|uniref:fimbrillin family protein n=1 Tax=Prevotella sp. E13-27 TaxID=2938122 RepID=UPI002009E81F|nr:fimbrillin family protein [Prevotella sp. E13-27]MCK8623891.1 fimbrillin family protein [Prevotella sp. E13-27]